MNVTHLTVKQRVYRGMKEYLAISFYLWLVFSLFALYRAVILSENNIPLVDHGFALINALALAKIMLVAKELHFADRFKEAPLIYPTMFKSVAFAILLGCFKILEETLIGLYHGRSFNESIAAVGGGTLKGILALMLLLSVVLIPFFGFTELGDAFGEGKLTKLFFTSRRHLGNSS